MNKDTDYSPIYSDIIDTQEPSNYSKGHKQKKRNFLIEHKKGIFVFLMIVSLYLLVAVVPDSLYTLHVDRYIDDMLSDTRDLNVELDINVSMIEYSHLGKDLKYEHKLNWKSVKPDDTVSIHRKALHFETTITESDSIPDTATVECDLNIFDHTKAVKTAYVTVKEDGGRRYKDAYATFEITYTVTPKPPFWDVVFYF